VDQSITWVSSRILKTLTLWRASFEKTEKQLVVLSISSGDIGTELKFTLESGQPVKVARKKIRRSTAPSLELMIVANSYVASTKAPDSSLLNSPVEEIVLKIFVRF
jgi:hypothetical protein